MCGIAGIWQLDGRPVERATIERFIGALAHRGPDGEGVLIDDQGRLALAHRRLAILDLSAAGDQPMRSPGGRYDITYNGEVYNFLELRSDLEKQGLRFRSDTDTEVILAAFERWGADALLRLNGMWAFAIWDRRERTLFLTRDRFGVKPLYVVRSAGWFAFASELKAFLHLDGFDPVADPAAVAARLAGNQTEHVLLRGVESLPPGHCLAVTPSGSRRWRWWSTLDHLHPVPRDLATQAEEFRELLLDACRLRLRCDVGVATSLSGGLDSSSVVCALAAAQERPGAVRQPPEWRRAFIAGFAGTPQDEAEHAALAAERAGATQVVRQLSGEDLAAHVDDYLYQFEEIGGLFGAAAWLLYREMRRAGIVVSLDGHGGDELLGGYDYYVMLAMMRGRGVLMEPRRTLDLIAVLRELQGAGRGGSPPSRAVLAALTIPGVRAVAPWIPRVRHVHGSYAPILRRHAFDPGTTADPALHAEERAIDALGPLTAALYRSFHRHSLPRILRNFDAHSMGHGVEVRMPLLDWRVVCYGFSAPDESKIARGYTKLLLRGAMQGVLPEPVRLRRDKLGYNTPVAHWLDHGLGDWLWGEVNDPEFLRGELWNGRALHALVRGKRESRAPWRPAEASRVLLAVTAHWWLTRWLRRAAARRQPTASV
jgi:asparagine synthase (glutamine-hydrolysing)